jgi:hypothetical protein
MKRLYYLTSEIESVEKISRDLHGEGITDWNFHVLSKDEAGLYRRNINSATPWQELDIVHTALRGTLIGAALGLLGGLVIMYITTFGLPSLFLMLVVGALFGTWAGGFVGISHENYKITRFHDDIEAGKYLIMVDAHPDEQHRVQTIMAKYPEAIPSGQGSTIINPLKGHMGGVPETVKH